MFHVAIYLQVQEEGERAFRELTREVTVFELTIGWEWKTWEGEGDKDRGEA